VELIKDCDLFDEVKKLKQNQRLFVDFPKETIDKIELLGFQIKSLDNLFMSYINNTTEIANELKLKKFLEQYCDYVREKDFILKDMVIKSLGTKVYNYIVCPKNNIYFMLDNQINKLVIGKRDNFKMRDN
jgi:hypothetical protein